jgi:RNase adaptor protein for sRNA GlmZ degradation
MRFLNLGLLLVSAVFTAGCLAFAAGAVGGAVANDNDVEQIDYYITTNSPPDFIAKAMRDERVSLGMNKEEVRLVLDANRWFQSRPKVDSVSSKLRWSFEPVSHSRAPDDPVIVHFDSTETVVRHNVRE